MNIGTDSQTRALLSGIRQIFQKAFGDVQALKYDQQTTNQLIAQAKRKGRSKPRYDRPVDFGGETGVWMSIIRERLGVKHLPNTSTHKAKVLRDHAIFLERHDAMSRSARLEQYFRVYDENGELQDNPLISRQLDACLIGQGGLIQRNYKDPKDPRRNGIWSDTVETQPLRVELLVNTEVQWLATQEYVGYLCSIRVKRDFSDCWRHCNM